MTIRYTDNVPQSIADEYFPFLANMLTPPRLQHSFGVMQVMGELAEIYHLDRKRAMRAGLLHDAAKDLNVEDQLALAEEAGIQFHHDCERHPVYLHAAVGAYVVAKGLNITDGLVLDAIASHSDSGDKLDSDVRFQWCLQAADILAPVSAWHGMKKLQKVVYAGQLEEAALLRCVWLKEYFQQANIPIHPNLELKYQALTARLTVLDHFCERE
ncbi:MAG TPA: bis(5'-nucleosyl)-tetraphosphatase (symmetrical) YqeK [Anaerolineae bacterium]|nr:bis(5'-nucleosyl)-tetraphosphatase (symmetrical) YqeK [Anaerolineae bacterium]